MQPQTTSVRHESRRLIRELGFLGSEFSAANVTHQQCHCILEIGNYRCLTALDLSHYLNLDKSTISRVVAQLQESGWIAITPSSHDRRKKLISLSVKGEKKYEEINNKANEVVSDALAGLSEKDQKSIADGMSMYASALRKSRIKRQFTIRPIRSSDNAAVAELIYKVMPEFGCDGPGFAMRDPEVTHMWQSYRKKPSRYYVLEYEGSVVGGAGIAPLEDGPRDTCELRKMYFLPSARGTGMGKELLSTCLEAAKGLGFKSCYLETTAGMHQAQKLYTRIGFQRLKAPLGKTGHSACDRWYLKELVDG